jgi:hypothetical protein
MVGAGHPTLADTLNRALLIQHNDNGVHTDIAGDGTKSITGFNIPLYLTQYLSMYDAITAWKDVRAYGNITLGAGASAAQKTENAATIQAAINSVTGAGADIRLPPGIIYIDGGAITVNENRIRIRGAGIHATQIYFDSGIAFTFSNGASILYQCELSNMAIIGQGSANKIAVKLSDVSSCLIENIVTATVTGNTSIGLQVMGRDQTTVRRCMFVADRPISIEANPNEPTIDLDHFRFEDVDLGALDNTQANVHIATGIDLNDIGFYRGAWNTGKYGLYWADTTTTGVSLRLTIQGVRYEQAADATGYGIYISHNYGLVGFHLDRFGTSGTHNGIYLRKVHNAHISNGNIGASSGYTSLNIDNTCQMAILENVYYDPSAAETITQTNKYKLLGTSSYVLSIYDGGVNSSLTRAYGLSITNPTVPANSGDTGLAGTIAWDNTYIYWCFQTNAWRRVAYDNTW